MILASTSAAAANRPQATRFTQPAAASTSEGVGFASGGVWLLGVSLAAVVAMVAVLGKGGNSPT
jgi:hypothetical protein